MLEELATYELKLGSSNGSSKQALGTALVSAANALPNRKTKANIIANRFVVEYLGVVKFITVAVPFVNNRFSYVGIAITKKVTNFTFRYDQGHTLAVARHDLFCPSESTLFPP